MTAARAFAWLFCDRKAGGIALLKVTCQDPLVQPTMPHCHIGPHTVLDLAALACAAATLPATQVDAFLSATLNTMFMLSSTAIRSAFCYVM